jgi:hypothetical protein
MVQTMQTSLGRGSPVAPGGEVGRNRLAVLFPVQSTAYPFIFQ